MHNLAPVYSLKRAEHNSPQDITSLVDLTENSDRDLQIEKLAKHTAGSAPLRGDLRKLNILDLNIMPINIHALMRDIPLANLYNYAYTFDRLIIDLYYGINNDFGNVLINYLCGESTESQWTDKESRAAPNPVFGNPRNANQTLIKSGKEMFIAMLINPYRTLDSVADKKLFEGVLRGDSNVPLGRPKFLGDQLLNKTLLGELYPRLPDSYGNRGPTDSVAHPQNLTYPKLTKGRASDPERATNADKVVGTVNMGSAAIKARLSALGTLRLNTVYVRNLVLMVNAYRSMRLRMSNDLVYDKGVIVSGPATTRWENTEFNGHQFQENPRDLDKELGWGKSSGYKDSQWRY
jgi:hypothetical protein